MRNGTVIIPSFVLLHKRYSNNKHGFVLSDVWLLETVIFILTFLQTLEIAHYVPIMADRTDSSGVGLQASNVFNSSRRTYCLSHISLATFFLLYSAALRYIEDRSAEFLEMNHLPHNVLLTPNKENVVILLMEAYRYLRPHTKLKKDFLVYSPYAVPGRTHRALHVVFTEVRQRASQIVMVPLLKTL